MLAQNTPTMHEAGTYHSNEHTTLDIIMADEKKAFYIGIVARS